MTTLPHPFLNHPDVIPIPNDKIQDVDEIYGWIKEQPRFPTFSKNHAYLFLHACHWDKNNTKRALHKYSSIRCNSPDIFDDRDPLCHGIQFVFNMTQMIALPHTTPEGYKILVYRLIDSDPSNMHFGEAIKAFCMFNDIRISEDLITEGYVVVFDMKGVRLGHVTRVQFGPLRTFMAYIQEAHPVRLKKVYIVHTASFINQIMLIVKPLIKSDILSLVQFTTGGPTDFLPKEILPVDYGGELDSILAYYTEQRKEVETKYKDWLIDSGNLRGRPKKENTKHKTIQDVPIVEPSPVNSFSRLEID